jgi:hypothetical protein
MKLKQNIQKARRVVLRFYVTLAVGALAAVSVYFAGARLRDEGFPKLQWLWNDFIPQVAQAIHADPWLLAAFLIVAFFLWSLPWEDLFGEFKQAVKPSDHRRGRKISGSDDANLRAYRELLQRRNAKRSAGGRSRRKS